MSQAEQEGFPIGGHAENRWLLLRHAKLGSGFNRPVSNVMIKFSGDSGDPVIFVPDKIQIDEAAHVCPNFLASTPCLKGWKALCPHVFQDVGDELLQFIACLCGFLANPTLCGCMGCPGKDAASQENEPPDSLHGQETAVGAVRNKAQWSRYVVDLIQHLQGSVRRFYDLNKLRFFLYPSGHLAKVRQDDAGVIGLGKNTPNMRGHER